MHIWKEARVVQKGSQWCVESESGKNLGCYPTKGEADDRLSEVEYFKHKESAMRKIAEIVDELIPDSQVEKTAAQRPLELEERHLEYLDDLRESGETNMFGARAYLEAEFPELESSQAKAILSYWMETFGDPNR